MKKIKLSLPTIALFESAGLTLYISFVAKFLENGGRWFQGLDPAWGITFFLLTFVSSAVISALLVLGYPIFLFFEGKRKIAIELVLWSAVWLVGFLGIFLSVFLSF